jgi:hypothetical protein
MFLSLLFRGSSGYTLLQGTREVGSLEGAVLRFHPFTTHADATRAADAGYRALVRWLSSRPEAPADGTRFMSRGPSEDAALTRWMGPRGTPIVRLSRHRPRHSSAPHDATEPPYAVEFILPDGTYPAVALEPAQRIHEAICAAADETRRAASTDVATRADDGNGRAVTLG